jgi:hypothetical protein
MSNYGFVMPVGRTEGAQIAAAAKHLQQQAQLQQHHQQQQEKAARRDSISASSFSSTSSRTSLLKQRLFRSTNARRDEMSAMLKTDALNRASIRIGI